MGRRRPLPFTVNNPAPTLTSLSQNTATAGDPGFTLTLTGGGFVNGSSVLFDGIAQPTTFVNGTTLEVMVTAAQLAAAGTFNVTVFNPAPGGGTSAALPFTVNNPVPTITSLTPALAAAGSPGLTLTVDGSNFVNGSIVTWDTAPLATTFIGNTLLTATVPAALLAVPGTAMVAVQNPAPGGGVSNGLPFVIEDLSSISGLNPSTACAGDESFFLVVSGSGLFCWFANQLGWSCAANELCRHFYAKKTSGNNSSNL